MALQAKNDIQIQAGTTTGLVPGLSYFTFDGTSGKPDFRGYEITIFEYAGRQPMIKGLDYTWNYTTGQFDLIQLGDIIPIDQWYTVQFQDPSTIPVPVTPSNLTDWTYFIRNITIPNIDPAKPANAPNKDRLDSFIQKYEPQCLIKILGYGLYKALLTETSQRMTDLIYGAEYTTSYGKLWKWQGLVQPVPKISLIANYIYFYYQEANTTQTSGVNTNIPKGEASKAVSPGDKMINSWEFFSSETRELLFFLWNQNHLVSPAIYPEITDWSINVVKRSTTSIYSPF